MRNFTPLKLCYRSRCCIVQQSNLMALLGLILGLLSLAASWFSKRFFFPFLQVSQKVMLCTRAPQQDRYWPSRGGPEPELSRLRDVLPAASIQLIQLKHNRQGSKVSVSCVCKPASFPSQKDRTGGY